MRQLCRVKKQKSGGALMMENFVSKKPRRAPVPAPRPQPSANDAADEVSWACSKCTYRHEEAEAGFLACAMCGTSKDA